MYREKIYLIISIDTECDKGPGWRIQRPMSFTNITVGLNRELTPLFEQYGIRATYLLSPEVINDDVSINTLSKIDNIELGAHLHEEFIEPYSNYSTDRTKSVQCSLSDQLERDKLVSLTNLFQQKIGYMPISFRAGRFGISNRTWKILSDLGYLVDSSVTPFKTHYYSDTLINNFWGYRNIPFKTVDSGLVQVPVTIINRDYSILPDIILRRLSDTLDLKKRVLTRLGFRSKSEWFRPYRTSAESLISIADFVIKHYPKGKVPVLNMMFHSNEILPSASPYCQTTGDVQLYIASMDSLFEHIFKQYDVCSVGLGEYAKYFE